MEKIKRNKVSIVVPVFNSSEAQVEMTIRCLDSIEKNTVDDYEIILIDDCSKIKTDFSQYKNLRTITHEVNQGISKGWNEGIKEAKYDYVCIINNDIEVFGDWTGELVKAFLKKPYGFTFPTPITTEEDMKRRIYASYSEGLVYGPCIMSSKDTYEFLKENGHYYDENLKIWFGDLDMFERARNKKVALTCSSFAFVKHLGSQTVSLIPEKEKLFNSEKDYYNKKHNKKKK